MKITKPVLFLLVCALALLFTASNSLADTATVKLTGVNGASQDGVYVDPYSGTINGSPATLVCDDFDHDTTIGESWTATVSTFADLNSARFQQSTPAETLQDYEEAAYLYDQLMDHHSQYDAISFALWSIFTPSVEGSSAFQNDNSQYWVNQAESQTYSAGEFSNFEILTPVCTGSSCAGSPQEFLTTISSTPEPANVLLLATGLVALSLMWRKKIFA